MSVNTSLPQDDGAPEPFEVPGRAHPTSPAFRILVIVGGIGLLFAMAIDAIAVIGRHTGLPLLGSIELVQAGALIAASTGILVATIERTHAVVHILIDRASPRWRPILLGANRLLSALFFLILLAGSVWLAIDLWHGFEESELARLPFKPLRIAVILSCGATAIVFFIQAVRRESK